MWLWRPLSLYVWHDSFICVTWLVHTRDMTRPYMSHTCDMTRSYMWHASCMCVTWLVHMCDICMPWLLHMCAMTPSCVRHGVFTCYCGVFSAYMYKWLVHVCDTCMTWFLQMCDMAPSCVCHDSFVCVTCLIHLRLWHFPSLYVWHNSFTCVTWLLRTGWRRLIRSPKLQVIFRKRATNYRAVLWKVTYKDKASYESSPPCKWVTVLYCHVPRVCVTCLMCVCHVVAFRRGWMSMVYICICMYIYTHTRTHVCVHMYIHICTGVPWHVCMPCHVTHTYVMAHTHTRGHTHTRHVTHTHVMSHTHTPDISRAKIEECYTPLDASRWVHVFVCTYIYICR